VKARHRRAPRRLCAARLLDPQRRAELRPRPGQDHRDQPLRSSATRPRRAAAAAARRGPDAAARAGRRRERVVPQEGGELVIDNPPAADSFTLEIRNTCAPEKNTELSGLYTSGGGFFTQCEAEGFRRITYFLDRPDVMAVYTVLLRADKEAYPVLLSNGNLVEQGELDNGRHFAKWHDPFPKPSYLFALVAGRPGGREQRIRTRSGREHLLQVYVRRGDLDKTEHAMNSLIASRGLGRGALRPALDLERFMIVAVERLQHGRDGEQGPEHLQHQVRAGQPATATDDDFAGIESVVAHEYFHNWTGNRVTCRDWFQLSLKEGLTVFRDQEFSMDMAGSASARAVKRIEDVRKLRAVQFPEDAGPMAHPVRPDSLQRDQQLLHRHRLRKGRRGGAHDAHAGGPRGLRARHGPVLPAPRRPGRDLRRLRAGHRRRQPGQRAGAAWPAFKRWYAQAGTPQLQAAAATTPRRAATR
jgi:aminopeptidase N